MGKLESKKEKFMEGEIEMRVYFTKEEAGEARMQLACFRKN